MIPIDTFRLNPNIFTDQLAAVSMREGMGRGLLGLGRIDGRVVVLCADLTDSTKTDYFAEEFPERFVQVGVAEQNMAATASGMAAMGKIPFVASFAIFSPGRNWEQIRTTVCYNDLPVKIIGSHAGVTVGADGGSHQALEDVALMRVLPRMTVLSPCDQIEARKAVEAAASVEGPVYIRLSRISTPLLTTESTSFVVGRASLFYGTNDRPAQLGIIATGSLVYQAMLAARIMEEKHGITVKVMNLSTIKPLDQEAILELARETGALITVEEHQQAGGMGSAVSELLAGRCPVWVEKVGVNDDFGQSGTAEELLRHYSLDKEGILAAAIRVLYRKQELN